MGEEPFLDFGRRAAGACFPVPPVRHFRRPEENTQGDLRDGRTTLLLGGLTARHDRLIAAALRSLGYRARPIPVPTKSDYQAGREYGNNGQCNPTYFTVGALVNYLKHLRDDVGLSAQDIIRDYAFATVGSCGPCRFGMYEAEYRLALQNAGFDGFRVFVVHQVHQYSGQEGQGGLEVSPRFYATLLNAVIAGDLLTMLRYQLAPYETRPGMVEEAVELCVRVCEEALRAGEPLVRAGRLRAVRDSDWPHVLAALRGRNIRAALKQCRRIIEERVEVDFLRPKPVVKITGEFWAQTTEGDGNFRMFSFLEQEGAEVLVEPVSTWIDYTLHMAQVRENDARKTAKLEPTLAARMKRRARARVKMWVLKGVQRLFQRAFEARRQALGGTTPKLASQLQLQRMGHPYYNSRCGGGEGHLEVAKNIYYTLNGLAHMVLSLKPFGCMPSTQSDGAQAAVMARYPDMTFLPIETSGEGDINAHSRVQMALGEAQAKCRAEFDEALKRAGLTAQAARAFIERRPELRRPLQRFSADGEHVGRAARFVRHLARLGAASAERGGGS